ncbi:uncharacterized protein LOC141632247 [Silene latifolia]|uniref:uncharacterized protein LOC141632247 n=1 Tax=Silene latifolia TaxID=37657 RepID=UPI003D77AB0F
MNDPLKQQEVLGFLKRNKVDCGAILVTHIKPNFVKTTYKRVFSFYSLETNYDSHHGGRIWLLWNLVSVHVKVLEKGAQYLHFSLLHHSTQQTIWFTVVYAFNHANERIDLWNKLNAISAGLTGPWLCVGDFNVSLSSDEKHISPRWAKLDRLLVNPAWFLCLNASVVFFPSGISDHAPVLLTTASTSNYHRPFKYLNFWALSPIFKDLVARSWMTPRVGSQIFSLFSHLRDLRLDLKYIHHTEFNGLTARVAAAKTKLLECQQSLQTSPLDLLLLHKEKTLVQEYFYAGIAAMRVQNTIGAIADVHCIVCLGQENVAQVFLTYYQDLLGTSESNVPLPSTMFQDHILAQPSHLDNMVTLSEIEAPLFSIDRNKSPGIDGYTSGFFRDTWEITGPAFAAAAVAEFFHKGIMPRAANSTLISLIPKSAAPKSITEFRPISCCAVFYKTVSKILANRKKLVLGDIIGL